MNWQGAPKSKASSILDALNEIVREGGRNELGLKKCEQQATLLLKDDAPRAYELLGIIEAIRCSNDKASQYFEKAIALQPHEARLLSNYAISLFKVGQFSEAIDYSIKAVNIEKENLSYLRLLINGCRRSGSLNLAMQYLDQWKKESPDTPFDNAKELESMYMYFSDLALSDDNVRAMIEVACSVLLDNGIYAPGESSLAMGVQEDDESKWFTYAFRLEEPVEQCVLLNEKIAEEFSKNTATSDALSIPFVITCECAR